MSILRTPIYIKRLILNFKYQTDCTFICKTRSFIDSIFHMISNNTFQFQIRIVHQIQQIRINVNINSHKLDKLQISKPYLLISF